MYQHQKLVTYNTAMRYRPVSMSSAHLHPVLCVMVYVILSPAHHMLPLASWPFSTTRLPLSRSASATVLRRSSSCGAPSRSDVRPMHPNLSSSCSRQPQALIHFLLVTGRDHAQLPELPVSLYMQLARRAITHLRRLNRDTQVGRGMGRDGRFPGVNAATTLILVIRSHQTWWQ